eukprot:6321340-Pyramimonas_sp.AAC.1
MSSKRARPQSRLKKVEGNKPPSVCFGSPTLYTVCSYVRDLNESKEPSSWESILVFATFRY